MTVMGRGRRRRGLWLRWALRDGRRRWVTLLVLGSIVGAGTGTYAALSSMSTWRRLSYDASYQALRAHDLRVEVDDGLVEAGRLAAAVDALPGRDQVAARSERLIVATTVDASSGAHPALVEGRIVGAPVADPAVDLIGVDHGRGLAASDDGAAVAVLESKFAHNHELPTTGALQLAGGRTLSYVGTGVAPDQFLITGSQGDLQSEATFATVYVPLATAQEITGHPGQVNDLVLRLRPGADPAAVGRGLEATLRTALPARTVRVTALADEETHQFLYRDISSDQRFFDVFAVIVLAGVALAAFNLSNRVVEAQRREIGIGQALGLPARRLALRPLLIGAQIAVASVIAGIIIGFAVNAALRGFLTGFLPMPVWHTPFQTALFARTSLLAGLLPIAAAAYPVWRATRVAPVDALRSSALVARSGGLMRLTRRHGRRRLVTVLPVRAILRTPRRTLFTALGIAAVLTTVVAVLGALDTFRLTVERSEAELYGANRGRVTVQLDRFRPADDPAVVALTGHQGVARADTGITLGAQLVAGDRAPLDVVATSYHPNPVWQPTVERPAPAGDRPGIVLTRTAAADLGLRPGDTVTVRHPTLTADGRITYADTPMVVTGLNPNPLRGFAYLDERAVAATGLAGAVNTLNLTPTGTSDQLTRDLFNQPGVAVVRPITATTRIMRDWITGFSEFLYVIELVVLPLALLIAYNAASVAREERAREHATALAIGMRTRTIIGGLVAESTLIGLLSTALGLIGGWLALGWVVRVAGETFPDLGLDPSLHPGTLAVAAAAGIVAVGLAPVLLTRSVNRIDVAAAIRTVE